MKRAWCTYQFFVDASQIELQLFQAPRCWHSCCRQSFLWNNAYPNWNLTDPRSDTWQMAGMAFPSYSSPAASVLARLKCWNLFRSLLIFQLIHNPAHEISNTVNFKSIAFSQRACCILSFALWIVTSMAWVCPLDVISKTIHYCGLFWQLDWFLSLLYIT